jgi:hypothetical protein
MLTLVLNTHARLLLSSHFTSFPSLLWCIDVFLGCYKSLYISHDVFYAVLCMLLLLLLLLLGPFLEGVHHLACHLLHGSLCKGGIEGITKRVVDGKVDLSRFRRLLSKDPLCF